MTAASSFSAGLSATSVVESAGGLMKSSAPSEFAFDDVMSEAMGCPAAESAPAPAFTGEVGKESGGESEAKQPVTSRKQSASGAAEDEEETVAATLEALALSAASQLRLPVAPLPPVEVSVEGDVDAATLQSAAATESPKPSEIGIKASGEAADSVVRTAQQGEEAKPSASEIAAAKRLDLPATAALDAPRTLAAESSASVERATALAGQGMSVLQSAGDAAVRPKPSAGKVSSLEGRLDRVQVSLAEELVAQKRELTPPSAAGGTENQIPLVRQWNSAAEARFTAQPPAESSTPDAASPSLRAGTGSAELTDAMKKPTEVKQFAGLASQALPEFSAVSQAMAPELVRHGAARSALAAGETVIHADTASQLIAFLTPDRPDYWALEETSSMPAAVGTGAPSPAESLKTGVLNHVTELRFTGATEMAVMLKPDADTQLALRLTMDKNGEVLVQARCEQGDAQLLAANWGEIRHSLAQQGVRLGALEFSQGRGNDTFSQHTGNGGPSPDGQSSSQRHGQPWPETLDDLPLVGSTTEPPTRRGVQRQPAGRNRLLESWA